MNDKELADAVVALGVGSHLGNPVEMSRPGYTELGRFYYLPLEIDPEEDGRSAEDFNTDWRVAGALMEKMYSGDIAKRIGADKWTVEDDYSWLQDPRAIIQACVEALT